MTNFSKVMFGVGLFAATTVDGLKMTNGLDAATAFPQLPVQSETAAILAALGQRDEHKMS